MVRTGIIRISRKSGLAGLLLMFAFATSSCVPLAIGAVGVAVGYIARDEGFGQAPPLEGGGYEAPAVYNSPAAYEDTPRDYDLPVY